MLQCAVGCCSVLQYDAVHWARMWDREHKEECRHKPLCVLYCVAVCCRLLQYVAVHWAHVRHREHKEECRHLPLCVLQCVAVCRSVLQCVAVCCSVLQSCAWNATHVRDTRWSHDLSCTFRNSEIYASNTFMKIRANRRRETIFF